MFTRIKNNNKAKKKILQLLKVTPKAPQPNTSYEKILFCPLNGTAMNSMREAIIAKSCEARGAKASLFYLNIDLPSSEFYGDTKSKYIYKAKVRQNIRFARKMNLKVVKASTYRPQQPKLVSITEDNYSTVEYKGIKLGDLVIPSVVREKRRMGPEWDNPEFIEQTKQATLAAQMLIDCYEKLLDTEKPDKLVMSHGVYISWGTLYRLARLKGIPVDVYGSSYRRNSLRFYHNAPNAPFPEALWPEYKNVDLSSNQLKLVDDYNASRETQKDDMISLFDEKTEIPAPLLKFVEESKDKQLFCLFTNISWDAFAFSDGNCFDGMTHWLEETVKYFNEHPEARLIIKAHPVEAFTNTPEKYRVKTFLKTLEMKENIFFISELESVKPFWLYEKIDYGLIHISTVCLEMALKDIVVLSSGAKGHYADNGFTLDPNSIPEYFEMLQSLMDNSNDWKPDKDAAKRYMFYRFFREAIIFTPLELHNHNEVKSVRLNKSEDILPGKDESLDIICEGILNDAKFVTTYE